MNLPASRAAMDVFETPLRGLDLLRDPLLNKGTAFTIEERDAFGLHGLLPPRVGDLDNQVERRMQVLRGLASDLERYSFMRELQDNNETLFYALLVRHLEELLPIVYTPIVGLGCEKFSHIFRKPRGLFLSLPLKDRMREILAHPRYDSVRVIVVSDGERILGLGDQGAGGMGIPIGKLALYTACAGIHPQQTLPILLDVGTNNPDRLADPLYIGWRHERVRGAEYDDFVEAFVSAVHERWPNVLLQWEDFARANAGPLLDRYRDRLCTFNDDIQGTAAVATGAVLAATEVTGVPLTEQRFVIVGAGSAGCGIARLLLEAMAAAGVPEREARRRFYALGRHGLLIEGETPMEPYQAVFAQPRAAVARWRLEDPNAINLYDVVVNAKPTVLIGTSAQPGVFAERIVRAMATTVARPAILPLSNPVSRSEATPADLIAWTEGRAIVGTGSPFPPVVHEGRAVPISQANNSYIFPGVGLGVLTVGARRVSDAMFMAAARALAAASPAARDPRAALLPHVTQLRDVAFSVAVAVAREAVAEGLAERATMEGLEERVRALMWEPVYRSYRRPYASPMP
jgi:malate dehydrogenase (oxaloacetate-decarboxylating)